MPHLFAVSGRLMIRFPSCSSPSITLDPVVVLICHSEKQMTLSVQQQTQWFKQRHTKRQFNNLLTFRARTSLAHVYLSHPGWWKRTERTDQPGRAALVSWGSHMQKPGCCHYSPLVDTTAAVADLGSVPATRQAAYVRCWTLLLHPHLKKK